MNTVKLKTTWYLNVGCLVGVFSYSLESAGKVLVHKTLGVISITLTVGNNTTITLTYIYEYIAVMCILMFVGLSIGS